MLNMVWPIGLVVLGNVIYNICAKSTPRNANAFLSLTVTYIIAGICSFGFYLGSSGSGSFSPEFSKLNWSSFMLGIAIVMLEFGYICVYRAGWKISVGSLVANITLACALILVGLLLYKETISLRQIIGLVVCAAGLALVSK